MSVTKHIVFILLATVLLYGCSAGEEERPGPDNGGVAVSLGTVAIGSEQAATRATADEPLAEGSTVRIVAYTDASLSAATYAGEGCYVMDGGTLKPCTTDADGNLLSQGGVTDGLWLRGGASYHFFAVTPAVAVDHTQTLPTAKVKNLTDFASSLTSGTGGAGIAIAKGASKVSVTLSTLQRRCAHLSFAFDRVWTNVTRTEIQSVKLTQMTDEPQQVAGTGDLPTDASHTQEITIGKPHFTTDATSPWLASGGAVVLPKASGSLDLTLSVCFNGSATPTELMATDIPALTFLKGLNYTFRVKLKDGVVVLVLEVEPWTVHASDSEAGTPPVGGGTGPWEGSDSNGSAGTPPGGSGTGPWEGSDSNGSAGTLPSSIIIGSWTDIVWNGSSGSGPSQIQPPGWEGSTSGGDMGSGPASVIISGWRNASWSGNVGSGGEMEPPEWTNSDISGTVG